MFPAAVTGVTADSWNVTGHVARGVVSRRKGKPRGYIDPPRGREEAREKERERRRKRVHYVLYTGIPVQK